MPDNILTIDIGGTKIRIIGYHGSLDTPEYDRSIPTDTFSDIPKESFIPVLLSDIASSLPESFSVSAVGIGIKGVIHANAIVHSSLSTPLTTTHLTQYIYDTFGTSTYHITNDVYAMAHGITSDTSPTTLINIGTGIRLTHILHGEVYTGNSSTAGEVSQATIWIPELQEHHELNTVISGRGIPYLHHRLSGQELSTQEILTTQTPQTSITQQIILRELQSLIEHICFFYNPQKIILTGSVSKSLSSIIQQIIQNLSHREYPFLYTTDIRILLEKSYANHGLYRLLTNPTQ